MIDNILKNYIKDYLNINKTCKEECLGENHEECEKCMIINAHKFLYGSLKKRLALSDEVDSSSSDIKPFLTGSYKRHTIIRPPKDVDGFIPLNADDYQNYTPVEIIELIYSELLEIYNDYSPKPDIIIQSHSVCVQFSKDFGADVIPAFPDGELYKIPELDGSEVGKWLVSNPNKHVAFVSEVNQSNDGLVLPIVKLLKSWKRDKFELLGIDMKSFHLEMLVVYILKDFKIENISNGLLTFFNNASYYLSESLPDPALEDSGYESNLNDLLSTDEKTLLINLISEDLKKVEEAFKLEDNDEDLSKILSQWKMIFTSDDFFEVSNEAIGEKLDEKISSGTTVYRSQDTQKLSFERESDEARVVPRASSWQSK